MTDKKSDSALEVFWENKGRASAQNVGVIAADAQKAFKLETDQGGVLHEDYEALAPIDVSTAKTAYLRGFQASLGLTK